MRPLQALSAAVLFLVLAASTSNASVLEDTCKSFGANNKDIGYDYCIRFFQADKGSATADKRGLAMIAGKITGATAKNTTKRIADLKASEKDKSIKEGLRDCADVYSSAVSELKDAVQVIALGTAQGLQDALTNLSAAMGAPETCEDGFGELGVTSPLINEDTEFGKEASVALAVTAALSPSKK